MALEQELTAEQLLQGLQKKDPRLYDLQKILIQNLKILGIATGTDSPRTLRKSTTGGTPAVSVQPADLYDVEKRVSLRI
jgi:hypothetical protein